MLHYNWLLHFITFKWGLTIANVLVETRKSINYNIVSNRINRHILRFRLKSCLQVFIIVNFKSIHSFLLVRIDTFTGGRFSSSGLRHPENNFVDERRGDVGDHRRRRLRRRHRQSQSLELWADSELHQVF